MNQTLNLRDLAILYVIADHNSKEADRLDAGKYPREARASLSRQVDISLLWGSAKEPERGILNQYIVKHSLGPILRQAQLVYRSISKLQEIGLLYGRDISYHAFAPTPAGLKLFEELKQKGDPGSWPEELVWSSGRADWQRAKYSHWVVNERQ